MFPTANIANYLRIKPFLVIKITWDDLSILDGTHIAVFYIHVIWVRKVWALVSLNLIAATIIGC